MDTVSSGSPAGALFPGSDGHDRWTQRSMERLGQQSSPRGDRGGSFLETGDRGERYPLGPPPPHNLGGGSGGGVGVAQRPRQVADQVRRHAVVGYDDGDLHHCMYRWQITYLNIYTSYLQFRDKTE